MKQHDPQAATHIRLSWSRKVFLVADYLFLAGAAMLCLLPLLAWQGVSPFGFDWGAIWVQIVYLSIFVSGIAYASYFYGLSKTDTSLGSMTFFVKPILASVFSALALHEEIGVNLLFGMILVLIGIVVVLLANKQAAKKAAVKKEEETA